MTPEKLEEILELHKKWLGNDGGRRANLSGSNLSNSNLSDSDLRNSDLCWSNLSGSDLSNSNLSGATLDGKNKITKPVITMSMSYWVLITEFEIRIGCKKFSHDEFMAVTEARAHEMDGDKARAFLRIYRPAIVELLKTYMEVI